MKDTNYLVIGRKEFFEIFERAGFSTLFIEDGRDLKNVITRKSGYDLIITQDTFYAEIAEIVNLTGLKTTIFCFPENQDFDRTEEVLKKLIIKAIGMEL